MLPTLRPAARIAAAAVATAVPASLLAAGPALAAAQSSHRTARPAAHAPGRAAPAPLRVRRILFGQRLRHSYYRSGSAARHTEPLTSPDDTTTLGGALLVAFQNGVGPQGQASTDGNTDSTVVEFTPAGRVLHQWDLHGKCDGLTADPGRGLVVATVNEDAHSSIYTIAPGRRVTHYRYSRPLPSKGGTDAITIYRGQVLVSASAPGTTGRPAPQPYYPAVYRVVFGRGRTAYPQPLFSDEARARVANLGAGHGASVRLALTDPDSNAAVPAAAGRFRGDFMLTSQGDKEQIFARPELGGPRLSVLRLSQSVDDTAWALARRGTLYAADGTADTVDAVTGRFQRGTAFVDVTPCDANGAPATCPGPGYPPDYLGWLNMFTGQVRRVPLTGPDLQPASALFIARGSAR